MTNLPLREKMKKITDATKQQNAIPERSKNAGLIVFLILFGMRPLCLFALAVGLVLTGHTHQRPCDFYHWSTSGLFRVQSAESR